MNYVNVMRAIYAKENIDAAIVTPEPEVCVWAESLNDLNVLTPPPGFCRVAINKTRLYEILSDVHLVPTSKVFDRQLLISNSSNHGIRYPVWMRDASEGTTSGYGSYLAKSREEERLWAQLHSNTKQFQVAEYLPGRNLACCMLFHKGLLICAVCAERIKYFMSHLIPSGVSGNTCEGKIFIDNSIVTKAEKAVRIIANTTNETVRGLVTVDLKEDHKGDAYVTEINLRHVAFTSAFTEAGFNMVEAQLLALKGDIEAIGARHSRKLNVSNRFYRDIDGVPVYVENPKPIEVGDSFGLKSTKD
jgi:carbamoyl-phosphate synthase large subunit